MFDSISKVDCYNRVAHSGDHLFTHYYRFDLDTSNDGRYIVQVEKFKSEFYVLKFYAKSHAASDNRFNLLTNKYHASRVLGTVISLANTIYQENKNASFGFIGEPIKRKGYEEPILNTKRFRLYKKLSLIFFKGEEVFNHYQNVETSAYVIINKKNGDSIRYSKDLIEMFISLYPGFSCEGLLEV